MNDDEHRTFSMDDIERIALQVSEDPSEHDLARATIVIATGDPTRLHIGSLHCDDDDDEEGSLHLHVLSLDLASAQSLADRLVKAIFAIKKMKAGLN